ncbi:uncharacterized protein LOC114516902 [Dendronephthya gigantea]|uniref:uncharacterized protein LOC114516902 n=1 Tax=Dendronephthya gigantea TaxID=151771 RepID=UPI0010699B33|nr:uncharacterized protein LOC114516902 [Dendronephthya gigantea]
MASRLTTHGSSPSRQKHSPKKSKKKTKAKEKNSPNGEAFAMGCSPSQAVIVQSTKTETSHLHPTIFMVGDKSFQMLRELGELNFYHLAQYNEAEDTAESLHRDIAARLENPLEYLNTAEQPNVSSNYHVVERSTCKINADYSILVHKPGPSAGLNDDELTTKSESENSSGNPVAAELKELATASKPSSNPTGLLKSSGSPTHIKDIRITAENTSDSPILLSSQPAPLKQKHIEIKETNESSSLTVNETKVLQNPKFEATTLRTKCVPDPFDEIFSAPYNTNKDTSAEQIDENNTMKLKPKTVFGRNRVTPKGNISDAKCDASSKCEKDHSSSTSLDDG